MQPKHLGNTYTFGQTDRGAREEELMGLIDREQAPALRMGYGGKIFSLSLIEGVMIADSLCVSVHVLTFISSASAYRLDR
jgi:hypothetical protein